MRIFKISLFTLLAVCSQFVVKAHDTKGKKAGDSLVQGNVLDADSRKPLSDVTISLSSVKQQNKKQIVSDASGYFLFPQMPPGEFTIQLEKKGYKTYRKDYMMMKEGMQLKVSLETEDEDSGLDSWNPLRMLYGK